MRRGVRRLILLVLMAAFALGVNRYIAAQKTDLTKAVATPDHTQATFSLPGTIYVAQGGQIYALNGGQFRSLNLSGRIGSWMQPHVLPDGSLLVIAHTDAYDDLYHVAASGAIIAQLTHNHLASKTVPIQANHWIYYPTTTADGKTLFASYDVPKPAYNVSYAEDLSIWSGTLANPNMTRWSIPDAYTGGDVQPQAVAHGGLVYASYAIAANNHVESVIGYEATPTSAMVSLTAQDDDCGSPAIAPDGVTLAMICTADSQETTLRIGRLQNGQLIDVRTVLRNCLCASPSWAPDGSGLLYLAPGDATGKFQLWWMAGARTMSPDAPKTITDGSVDLDATSAATWLIPGAVAPTPIPLTTPPPVVATPTP